MSRAVFAFPSSAVEAAKPQRDRKARSIVSVPSGAIARIPFQRQPH